MPRPKLTSTQRGLGHDHQKRRASLLPAAIGQPCPLQVSPKCTGMMTNPALMELDHSTPRALGGTKGDRIVCKACNRSAGARLGHRLRRARAQRKSVRSSWPI